MKENRIGAVVYTAESDIESGSFCSVPFYYAGYDKERDQHRLIATIAEPVGDLFYFEENEFLTCSELQKLKEKHCRACGHTWSRAHKKYNGGKFICSEWYENGDVAPCLGASKGHWAEPQEMFYERTCKLCGTVQTKSAVKSYENHFRGV